MDDWHISFLTAVVPTLSGVVAWVLITDRRVTRLDEKVRRLEADIRACLKRSTDAVQERRE